MVNPLDSNKVSQISAGFSPGLESPSSGATDTIPPTVPGSLTWSAYYTSSVSQSPTLTWTSSTDESGDVTYEVALGISAGDTSVLSWQDVGTNLSYQFSGAMLTNGIQYYASVRAKDPYGNFSAAASSDNFVTLTNTSNFSVDFSTYTTHNPINRNTRAVGTWIGTYYDSTGTIRTAPTNYLLQSEAFDNASWTKNASTITANVENSPALNLAADEINEGSTTAVHSVSQNVSSLLAGTPYTLSVYIKYIDQTYAALNLSGTAFAALPYAIFNISTGVLESSGNGATDAQIYDVGGGWYRITLSATAGANGGGTSAISLRNSSSSSAASYAGTNKRAYIYGAQLENRASATYFIPTATAQSGGPRFDYDPTSCSGGVCAFRGLLLESAKTNMAKYSETFTNAIWVKSNLTAATGIVTSPMATLTGNTLTESSDGTTLTVHEVTQSAVTLTASVKNVVSFFVKPNGRSKLKINFSRSASTSWSYSATYDLINNTAVGTGASTVTATINKHSNGWSRIELSGPNGSGSATGTVTLQLLDDNGNSSYVGDGVSGIYIWGAQFESGGAATSYIQNAGTTTLTRSADSGTISGNTWMNLAGEASTLYAEGEPNNDDASQFTVVIRVCTLATCNNDKIEIQGYNNKPVYVVYRSGSLQYYSNSAYSLRPRVIFKSILAYENGSFRGGSNGILGSLVTTGTVPNTDSIIYSGVFWLRKLKYWPMRLNDAQIEAYTK
tara:strand:- start:2838 stop:5024 length:2187 start_codon:yes stop_codon:yes gene_type:complete